MFRKKKIPPLNPEETAQRDHAQKQIEEIADILKTRKYTPPEPLKYLAARIFLTPLFNSAQSESKAFELKRSMEGISKKEAGFTGISLALDHAKNALHSPEFTTAFNRDMELTIGDFIREHALAHHIDSRQLRNISFGETWAGPILI